jgi:hypothetical protein
MNCSINSASHFSGLQAGMSPISLVQLAGSVRKFNLNRPFILPILAAALLLRRGDHLFGRNVTAPQKNFALDLCLTDCGADTQLLLSLALTPALCPKNTHWTTSISLHLTRLELSKTQLPFTCIFNLTVFFSVKAYPLLHVCNMDIRPC